MRRCSLFASDGVTTRYAYDAAGRLVREGSKTYRYGYLDKVLSVTDGDTTRTFTYHADGQLASANYGDTSESFAWDGLALIQRGDEQFVNEPHVGGGNPVASSKGTSYFNDMLGTTVGSKSNGKYSAAALTAFGERLDNVDSTSPAIRSLGEGWFTGKPMVEGLGHAFWMRNYRASLAKWQTADPLGYPDGWNQLAYCGNGVTSAVDLWGCFANIGDIKTFEGYESLPTELVQYTLDGFVPKYERRGSDTKPRGNLRKGVLVPGSVYLYNETQTAYEYWALFTDDQDMEDWILYDCILTVTKDTVLSKLAKYTGNIGDIGGGIGLFLRRYPWFSAGMTVASAIGKLEACMKKNESFRLGLVYRLESIRTSKSAPYEGFFKSVPKIKIVVE